MAFPEPGSNEVTQRPRYIPPSDGAAGRVYLNRTQYIAGIDPDTWEQSVGGYQPLEKWLKDRKGHTLSHSDISHYLRMVLALRESRRLMAEIEALIPHWPLP